MSSSACEGHGGYNPPVDKEGAGIPRHLGVLQERPALLEVQLVVEPISAPVSHLHRRDPLYKPLDGVYAGGAILIKVPVSHGH